MIKMLVEPLPARLYKRLRMSVLDKIDALDKKARNFEGQSGKYRDDVRAWTEIFKWLDTGVPVEGAPDPVLADSGVAPGTILERGSGGRERTWVTVRCFCGRNVTCLNQPIPTPCECGRLWNGAAVDPRTVVGGDA